MSRLTRVQQDVIDRLRDGWVIVGSWAGGWVLETPGEAKRHVANVTMLGLIGRALIWHDGQKWVAA